MGDAFSDSSYCDFCGRKTGAYIGHYGGFCGQRCMDTKHLKVGTLKAERRASPGEPNEWAVVHYFPWTERRNFKDHPITLDRIVGRYVSEEVAKLAAKEMKK